MRSRPASVIEILYDGDDITQHVLFAETSFETVAGAAPGQGTISCKDPGQDLEFVTGKSIELVVDGDTLWGGIVMSVGRKHFFPAVDSRTPSNVKTRKWVLGCYDWNIFFDKRVLNNPNDYMSRLKEPGGPLGGMVIYLFDRFVDTIPGLQIERKNEGGRVGAFDRHYPKGLFIGQGKLLRDQMEDLAQYGGAVWYIDPEKRLVFDTVEDAVWGKTFVDSHPNWVTTMGFREGEINQDGMQIVTDALVWGGSEFVAEEEEDAIVFARYPDPPANLQILPAVPAKPATEDHPAYPEIPEQRLTVAKEQEAIERLALYGRWQRAEMRAGEPGYLMQESVDGRAYTIVAGPTGSTATGIDGGLNQPLWQVKLAWFAHDVPNQDHIRPGELVDFIFYTMGDLSLRLPCRRFTISFPGLDPTGKAFVRFDGEFGISYTDPRFLWKFLFGRRRKVKTIVSKRTSTSTSTARGDRGEFDTVESPNGSRVVFTIGFPYLSQTTEVYLNGLRQQLNLHYTETDPTTGEIEFEEAPESDDTIRVVCVTGDS